VFPILPPGHSGELPSGHSVYRSGTNNVFIFRRSFYNDLANISPAVDVVKQSVLYPLGKKNSAERMTFLDASGTPHEMLPRSDATAVQQLKYLVDSEGTCEGASRYVTTSPVEPSGDGDRPSSWALLSLCSGLPVSVRPPSVRARQVTSRGLVNAINTANANGEENTISLEIGVLHGDGAL
jgi:hypothetical protein